MGFIKFALVHASQLDHHSTHNLEPELQHNVRYIIKKRFVRKFTLVCLNKTETVNFLHLQTSQPTEAVEEKNYFSEPGSVLVEII